MSGRFPARIIPAKSDGPVQKSQGTKVMVGDVELSGVTKVVLTAEVNDIWRAEIHCHAICPDEVLALAELRPVKRPWWRSLLRG